jgi:hypothetical protein
MGRGHESPSGHPGERLDEDELAREQATEKSTPEEQSTDQQDPVWRVGHERVVTRDHGEDLPGLNTWGAEAESVEHVDDDDDDWAPTTHRDGPERP